MDEPDWMAKRFEEHRPHMRAVAYRILGSLSEADDALQETWLRLSRSDTSEVQNLGGWLTTVVARVCLTMLSSKKSRREHLSGASLPEPAAAPAADTDPEHQALLADSVGLALLVVLDTLTPAERLAFVLHDLFDIRFEQIAPIIGKSPADTRQLASRARRRVQGAATTSDPLRQQAVVSAFLAASRDGHFDALLTLLDPDVVYRADRVAVAMGSNPEVTGAAAVASTFSGRAQAARAALIDGVPGLAWMHRGQLRVVFSFTVTGGRITGIDVLADPSRLARLDVTPTGGKPPGGNGR